MSATKDQGRKAKLDAAVVLYQMLAKANFLAGGDQEQNDKIEEMYRATLKEAQDTLDKFRAARAARLAIDALLPGWHPVDASDHLPRELWHAFVSNDRAEWLEWLRAHDVPERKAVERVDCYTDWSGVAKSS